PWRGLPRRPPARRDGPDAQPRGGQARRVGQRRRLEGSGPALGRTAPRARATPDALARGRRARPRAHGAVAARRAARVIAMLSGVVRKKLEDRIVLECGGVGYEVFLPPITIAQLEHVTAGRGGKASGHELGVCYPPTRDPPRPALIGFTSDLDKEFFERSEEHTSELQSRFDLVC